MARIRVGIVGAGPDRGWARAAHLPALDRLDEFEVTAVATSRPESARRAADQYGVPHAFADAGELAEHPDVDLVVVSVKAPAHAAAIRPALAAGKHVFTEWPLGVDLTESIALADAAAEAGVTHVVGLQGLRTPDARFVKDLLAEGAIGKVESVSVISAGDPLGGSRLPRGLAWSADRKQGNDLLSIMGGHTMALIDELAGPFVEISAASVATFGDGIEISETGETVPKDVPDQIALFGRLAGGALASVSIQGGNAPAPDGFLIKIAGTEGKLAITPVEPTHYMNWGGWRVRVTAADGTTSEPSLPSRYHVVPADVPPGPAASVAAVYREIAAAIAEGRPAHPSFQTAVRHHGLVDATERAAETGRPQATS
ncbi:MAG TPA: Gfo/Idh/MocA family oxidoreductase [Streptosporangiaceae bacterium]